MSGQELGRHRSEVPPGLVSAVRGRWQRPALQWVTWMVLALAAAGAAIPGPAGWALAWVAVVAVMAVPLLRVSWLVLRWGQEGDRRFVLLGLSVLLVAGAGVVVAALGR